MKRWNPLNWWKKGKDDGVATNIGAQQVIQEARQTQTAEELARELGINKLLMKDENIEELLQGLTFQTVDEEDETRKYVEYYFASLLVFNSQLNRTSNIDRKQAKLQKLRIRRHMLRKLIQMPEYLVDTHLPDLLEALESRFIIDIEEAIKGKRARLIKTTPRTIEAKVVTEKQ